MNEVIKESLSRVEEEEKRLEAEAGKIAEQLAKVRAVKKALLKAEGAERETAPPGALEDAIVKLLAKAPTPMSNGDIRQALKKSGYAFSLLPIHVTKNLARLVMAKRVVRLGEGKHSKYKVAR